MNEDFYISLIYKRLDSQLSEVEEEQLSEWLAEDIEHQALADDLALIYSESDDYLAEEIDTVDVQAAFEEQLELIGEEITTSAIKKTPTKVVSINKNKRRGLRRMQMVSIAASVVALIVVGVWWMDLQNGTELTAIAEQGAKEVTLADGSEVILEEGSELVYPSKFSEDSRTVKLIKGQANFSVTKGGGTFQIRSQQGTVTVLGTVFDVVLSDNELKLTVTEGKVNLKSSGTFSEAKTIDVEAGEEVVMRGRSFYKGKFTEEGRTNYFEFNDVNLVNAINEVAAYFGTEVNVNENLQGCSFTATLNNKSLKEFLAIVDATYNSQTVAQNDGSYTIKKGVCQ